MNYVTSRNNNSAFSGLSYVWHQVPEKMVGPQLKPLRALVDESPELAAVYASKYAEREPISRLYVPQLDCFWSDVMFFSLVHPQLVNNAMYKAGHNRPEAQYFQIPVAALQGHEAVYLDLLKCPDRSSISAEAITPFDHHDYCSRDLSANAPIYYAAKAAKGERALSQFTEPHILVRGFNRNGRLNPLDVSMAEIITVQASPTIPPRGSLAR